MGFFGCDTQHAGPYFPAQASNLHPPPAVDTQNPDHGTARLVL